MNMDHIIQFSKAVERLYRPFAEVVIHDLKSQTIYAIFGTLSQRKIGDPSYLNAQDIAEEMEKMDESSFQDGKDGKECNHIIYPKINWDGKLVKSTSLPLRDKKGKLCYLVCINFDVSWFKKIQTFSEEILISPTQFQPEALFKNDFQEKINRYLHGALLERGGRIETLRPKERKHLVYELFLNGAFDQPKAVDYVASLLKMGRATIFNYLRDWRNK